MKIKLSPLELNQVKEDCLTLRSCPIVPWTASEKLNDIILMLKLSLDKFKAITETISERNEEIRMIKDQSEKDAAFIGLKDDIKKANKTVFEITLNELSKKDFFDSEGKQIEINGQRETIVDGNRHSVLFRDCYFNLVYLGLIK